MTRDELKKEYFDNFAEVSPRRAGDHRLATEVNNAVKSFDWFYSKLEEAEQEKRDAFRLGYSVREELARREREGITE